MKPIIVVRDRAIDVYGTPFVTQTTAQAVRSFTDEVNNTQGNSAIAQHPDDYDLYIIGHYDETIAGITPLEMPELVVRAKDLIRPKGE